MNSLSYNNINLSVNNINILAESCNFSENSQQKPIYNFNNSIPFDNTPTFLKGSVSISYYCEPKIEPNYSTITGLLADTTIPLPSLINLGNVFITGYLNSYSLQLSPNGLLKANSSYDIYYPFTGNLAVQNSSDSNLYDTLNSTGIGHYWSSNFMSGSNIVSDNKILQLGYSAQIGISPIYSIGNSYPVQVYITNVTELLDVLMEEQFNVAYSGNHLHKSRPDLQSLTLSGINYPNSITISMAKFINQESKFDISENNIVLFNNTYSRSI